MLKRLKRKKQIKTLFERGVWVRARYFGVRVLRVDNTCFENEKTKIFFGVSVPKRNISKAVCRNRLKRQMRVAFEKQKSLFVTSENGVLLMMFCYFGKKKMPYQEIVAELNTVAEIFQENPNFCQTIC